MSKELIKRLENYKTKTGKTYFEVAHDFGIPEATLHRWRKKPASMQKGYFELIDLKLKNIGY